MAAEAAALVATPAAPSAALPLTAAVSPLPADWATRPVINPEVFDLLDGAPVRRAAVLVGLQFGADGPQLILTRRHDQLRHHAGQVSFPGGRMDAGDRDPIACALREADEEIGLPAHSVDVHGVLAPSLTISAFAVTPVVGFVAPDFCPTVHSDEVAECFTVPWSYIADPANRVQRSIQFRGAPRAVEGYLWHGRWIWGATATIIGQLLAAR